MTSAGANGYLLKDVSANELADAIRRVHGGETVLSFALPHPASGAEKTAADSDTAEIIVTMGVQQKRVLALLTKELTNPEIAAHMGVSLPTARYHASAILQKWMSLIGLRPLQWQSVWA